MRLLIIGAGSMAAQHASRFAAMDEVEVVAAVDTRAEALAAFIAKHGIERSFASVEQALDWGGFDAVTIVTPDGVHKQNALPCLAAGKHVLCEKPLAPNHADAQEMAQAAKASGKVAMVNLTYRKVAALSRARQLVQAGELGQLRHIEASYLQSWLCQPAWGEWRTEDTWLWRLSSAHGSLGVLGDIGIHLFDFICHGADLEIEDVHCRLRTFHKAPGDRIGDYALDANDSATMDLSFSDNVIGVAHATRWASGHFNDLRLRIFGDKGALDVVSTADRDELTGCLGDDLHTATWQPIDAPAVPWVFDRFAAAVRGQGEPHPDFAHAAKLQRILDQAFATAQQRLAG